MLGEAPPRLRDKVLIDLVLDATATGSNDLDEDSRCVNR